MKLVYIGTNIPEDAHKSLRVAAAQEGESVSSLLKRLCLDFVASPRKSKTNKIKGAAK
jgi:plasmid stability protein